jgi:hypothetical protein
MRACRSLPVSDFTFATVIVTDADKTAAQTDMGAGFFTVALSADGSEPATHWMSSGPFENAEMDAIVNDYTWPKVVHFGQDWQAAIATENLQMVVAEPVVGE